MKGRSKGVRLSTKRKRISKAVLETLHHLWGSPVAWRGRPGAISWPSSQVCSPPLSGSFGGEEVGGGWRSLRAEDEGRWSQDPCLPCPGRSTDPRPVRCWLLLQLLVCFCEACRNWPFHLPFMLWVTQMLSHCFRNWLCADSIVEVFPQPLLKLKGG